MTGFKELTCEEVTIRFDDDPKNNDRAIDVHLIDPLEETPLSNCMTILIRSTGSVEDLIRTSEIVEEEGIQKGRFDGIFINFPKDVVLTTHVIREDLVFFFLERK